MKTVRDKMIKETIRLDQCQKGYDIFISSQFGNYPYVGGVRIVNIKPLSTKRGWVQIKYNKYGYSSKIMKINLDGATMVEHTRKATASDHGIDTSVSVEPTHPLCVRPDTLIMNESSSTPSLVQAIDVLLGDVIKTTGVTSSMFTFVEGRNFQHNINPNIEHMKNVTSKFIDYQE